MACEAERLTTRDLAENSTLGAAASGSKLLAPRSVQITQSRRDSLMMAPRPSSPGQPAIFMDELLGLH